MTSPGHILSTCTVFNGEDTFSNHLTSIWANNMDTKDLIRFLFCDEFYKPISIQIGLGTRVGSEAEFANIVFDAFSLEVLLCTADPGNFGVCVNNRGNGIVIDMTMSRLDVFDGGNT